VSNNIVDENLHFMGTIVHELTHIHDFIDFANQFSNGDLSIIDKSVKYRAFFFWTEFHARKTGYLFLRKTINYFYDMKSTIGEQLEHIRNVEYELHHRYLLEQLSAHKNNTTLSQYTIANYLGRISAWETLFPNEFSAREFIPDFLFEMYGKMVLELYEVLNSMFDFNEAKNKLDDLELVLNMLI
jgi:hypothetical protein